jgi:hypothetical protein
MERSMERKKNVRNLVVVPPSAAPSLHQDQSHQSTNELLEIDYFSHVMPYPRASERE